MPRNEVKVKVTADTAAAEASVSGLGSKMGGILKAGAIAAGVAIIATGGAALSMAANFETAFAEVTTLLSGTATETIDALRSGVRELSRDMGIDATEATKALYQAISAGVDPGNAIEFLRVNTMLAVGGVTDLKTAVDLTTTVLNAFGLAQSEVTNVSDAMFRAVEFGKTTIGELGASMFNVAPIAAQMGVSVDTVAAALAALAFQGVPTSQATTMLRQAIISLAAPTQEQSKLLGELGVNIDAATIEEKGLLAVMQEIVAAAGGNDSVLRKLVGSNEALMAILALTADGGADFTAALDLMENKAGATKDAFEVMNETFERQFSILKEQVKFVMMDMALAVLPALTEAVKVLVTVFEVSTQVIGASVTFLKENRLVAIGLAAAVATLLAPAFIALTGTILTATAATLGFIAAQALAAAPLVALALAVAALTVGIVLMVENWDAVTAKVEGVVEGLQRVPGQLLDLGRAMGIELARGLASAGRSIWEVAKSIVRGIITILNPFNWVFGSTMTEVYERQGEEAGGALVGSLAAAFQRVSGIAAPLLEPLKEVRDFIGGLQSEMARLLGLGTVEGTDEQLRLAELRLELLEKEGGAEQELERIQRDRLERLAPLEERLAEARAKGSPSGLINLLERQIKAINDEETAIERDIRVLKEQIATIEQATEVRRLETEILGLRGKAADATLLSDAELVTAAEKMIEAIARETETFAADAALIHTTFIPALEAAGGAEGELGEATGGLISGEGGLADLQEMLDGLTVEPFELEMFDAGEAIDKFKTKVTDALGGIIVEFAIWSFDMLTKLEEWIEESGLTAENFLPRLIDGIFKFNAEFQGDMWRIGFDAGKALLRGLFSNEFNLGNFLDTAEGFLLPKKGSPPLKHQGGEVPGMPGTEVLIRAQAGEVVQTAEEAAFDDDRGGGSGGGIVIHELHLHGPLREALADLGLEVR